MSRTRSIHSTAVFLLLCLLSVAAYYPGLSGDYMFDDMQNILQNQRLVIDTMDLDTLQSASLSSGSGLLRRPVSMLSFALNRYFFGIDPYSYKVINLIVHLLTGVGLLLLGRLIMRSYRELLRPSISPAVCTWLPVLVSGLWLVHPLNLTGVLYIVQRMTSLSALFTVAGLCCYVAGRQRLLTQRPGWHWIFSGLIVFGGLAVFSKENGVLLPLYMFVLELVLFRFRTREGAFDKRIAGFFGLFLLVPALGLLLLLASQPGTLLNGYNGRAFTLTERLLTEGRILVFYLKQIVAPTVSELGLYHDDIPLSRGLFNPVTTLYALVALTGLLTTALLLIRKLPLTSLGILWFFAGHVLESTILPLELAHEHRNYLADFGILLAIGGALIHLPGQRLAPAIRILTPALFIGLFAYTTWVRAEQWSENFDHAIFEAMHHPDSPRAVFSAGRMHARLAINGEAASIDLARQYLEHASKLDNSGIIPDVIMIKLAYILELPVNPAWFNTVNTKLSHPISAAELNGLQILADCPQTICKIPQETMETLYTTVLTNDSLQGAWARQAQAYTSYGFYVIKAHGQFGKGRDYLTRATAVNPGEPQHWVNLIKLLVKMRDFDAAERQLEAFRSADAKGATERDFERLNTIIDKGRMILITESAESSEITTVGY